MAGFATRASFTGHPSGSATTGPALTSNPDPLMGAGQRRRSGRTSLTIQLIYLNARLRLPSTSLFLILD
jgi:hypothetical protein